MQSLLTVVCMPIPGITELYFRETMQLIPASRQNEGSLYLKKKKIRVLGQAWHDHEYLSGIPSSQVAGWDWFSIQFDDSCDAAWLDLINNSEEIHPLLGTEVVIYTIRSQRGAVLEGSKGTFIHENGDSETIIWNRDFIIQTGTADSWTSPATGTVYPMGWCIEFPLQKWVVEIFPLSYTQLVELKLLGINYWEGACKVTAKTPEGTINDRAYVEMVGYDKPIRDWF